MKFTCAHPKCKKHFEDRKRRKFCSRACSEDFQKSTKIPRCPICTKCGKPHDRIVHKTRCPKCWVDYQISRFNAKKIAVIRFLGGKCQKCDRADLHPTLFQLHHFGEEKEFDWNKLRKKSIENIQKELTRCELLCAFCHIGMHTNMDDGKI